MRFVATVVLVLACVAAVVGTVDVRSQVPAPARREPLGGADYFAPLPQPTLSQRALLGRELFVDTRLSEPNGQRELSCASCHKLTREGAGATPNQGDARRDGTIAKRNSPSVFNAALSFRQRWDGDVYAMEDVISIPLTNHMHAGLVVDGAAVTEREAWRRTIKRVADAGYGKRMLELYREYADDEDAVDHVSRRGIEEALTEYMKALVPSEGSPFELHLHKKETLKGDAAEGMELFKEFGCVSCHQGRGVGGNMLAQFGVMLDDADPFVGAPAGLEELMRPLLDLEKKAVPQADGSVVQKEQLKQRTMYKVPSLRNVARSGPYFHTGTVPTLPQAVRVMAWAQLGRDLKADELTKLVAFLESLNGEPVHGALPESNGAGVTKAVTP